VGHFLDSLEPQDLVHVVQAWAQAAVGAKDGVVHRGREWQVVEELSEVLPDVRVAVLGGVG
jgi:hypothetical protein